MTDVLVVGGGPVGLVTALQLHRAGLQVRVLERRGVPVDKACGEGLMPAATRALAGLGVCPTGRPFTGISYLDGSRRVLAPFRAGQGLGVRRTELSAALVEHAQAAAIPIERISVTGVEQGPGGVRAGGVRARYLVAADGLHSPIRRQLGLHQPAPAGRPPRWGLRRHYSLAPWSDQVEVYWSREAEAYVTPVAEDLVGVAVLTGRRCSFEESLTAFPQLHERLAGVSAGQVSGAGPLRQRVRSRVAGRVLLVGDAAGYVDALTGEGLAVGFECARRLADCLAAGRPDRYEQQWQQATRRYRWLTGALVTAAQNPLARRAIVPAADRLPWAYRQVVHQLAR